MAGFWGGRRELKHVLGRGDVMNSFGCTRYSGYTVYKASAFYRHTDLVHNREEYMQALKARGDVGQQDKKGGWGSISLQHKDNYCNPQSYVMYCGERPI